MGNCDGNGYGNGDRVGDGNGDGNGNGNGDSHGEGNHYKGRVASSCGGNVQCFWRGDTLPPPPMDTNERACVMGVTLLRVFAPLQGGGFLTAQHHGLFFVIFLQLLFSLLNNPLFAPPHYSGAQEPSCQPIDALPPPLLQEPRQPIDNLPQLLLHFLSR
jgi:hypothetical protein